jgi:hypothetical protein
MSVYSELKRICRAAAAVAMLALPAAEASAQAVFVVDNTGNSSDANVGNGVCRTSGGVCTLRAAIMEANANSAADTIRFSIGGGGPQRITLSSALPTITRPVVIDGASQPGYVDAPLIEIDGGNQTGLVITGGGTTLRALVINHFSGTAVTLRTTGNNVIEGCYIGTNAAGTAGLPNTGAGIRVEAPNTRIGGRDPLQRNIISGNTGRDINGGILVYGSTAGGTVIQGNYIGLDVTGMVPIPNEGRGVAIHESSGNFVGGAQAGAGNLIASNRATGVRLYGASHNNVVQGNWIGVDKTGAMRFGTFPEPNILSNARGVQIRGNNNVVANNLLAGNTWDGVLIFDGHPTDNLVYRNIITGNGVAGIGAYYGSRNRFIMNSIWDNFWTGIELGPEGTDGVSWNDPGDLDGGTNDGQNYPIVTNATTAGVIAGTLNSRPGQTFLIELFVTPQCSRFGYGEGKHPIGFQSVTTNASGDGSFNFSLGRALPGGWVVTANATDAVGNTSEFSACAWVR